MQCAQLIFGVAAGIACLVGPAGAQTERPLPEAAALFDTAVAHLIDLELAVIHARAQGQAVPHPDVTVPLRQIASLRDLLAAVPDSVAVNAAIRGQLVRALHARLASVLVTQRLVTMRQDPTQPSPHTLRKEEELLRKRLRDLGATQAP
jgi:hypothetical protein